MYTNRPTVLRPKSSGTCTPKAGSLWPHNPTFEQRKGRCVHAPDTVATPLRFACPIP